MASAKQTYIAHYLRNHPGETRNAAEYKWRIRPSAPGTKAEKRGHRYTPEHGRGALAGVPKTVHFPGREVRSSYSDRQAEGYVNKAAGYVNKAGGYVNKAANEGARVVVKVHTVNGWYSAGGARGYSASYVAELQAKAGSLRTAVVYEFGRGGDDYDMPKYEDAIDAWQIDILE